MQNSFDNYQKQLERLIEKHALAGEVPHLLLHSCCGPCSSYVLEYLAQHFKITLFYYNPNIMPEEEYQRRLNTQKQLLGLLSVKHPVTLIEGAYEPEAFLLQVKGLEDQPEGAGRCAVCFNLRLEKSARLAKELGCAYFCTTLSVSPHKNAQVLGQIASQVSDIYAVAALPADFKKKGGYQRSIVLAKQYGLYRQEYCGCPFSMP